MTQEQFDREKAYRVTISIAKSMLKTGLINEQEYKKIDVLIAEKYQPIHGILGS